MPVEDWNLLDGDVIGWHRRDHPRMRRIFAETTELRMHHGACGGGACRGAGDRGAVGTILAAAYAMHPEADDVQTLFDADCRFHVTILDATHNQVMRQMRQIILTMLRVSYEFGVRPENAPVTRQGHILVAEAIARHDREAARENMATMLERNRSLARVQCCARRGRSNQDWSEQENGPRLDIRALLLMELEPDAARRQDRLVARKETECMLEQGPQDVPNRSGYFAVRPGTDKSEGR